jgi:hypothetical protein
LGPVTHASQQPLVPTPEDALRQITIPTLVAIGDKASAL